MTIHEAYRGLMYRLFDLYDDREAANIADMVIEHATGQRKIDRIVNKQMLLSDGQVQQIEDYVIALLQHRPVQYVLQETWFAGLKFFVNEHVLIPRPETDELVDWIIKEAKNNSIKAVSMLDIGTGSGCIPVALKKTLPAVEMYALDVSTEALNVARKNAAAHHTTIHFYEADILNESTWQSLPRFDVIVSNPPYIKQSEAGEMRNNVLLHEPSLALFVPGEDALLFYRAIADFALLHLHKEGNLFFEINEATGDAVIEMLANKGFKQIDLKKDLQGKDRMVKALFTS